MCHEQSQSGGASITFFSSVYQINISYTLRFVDVEFFISIPYMHSTNYCVWYPNNPRKCKSRHFSQCVIGGWLTWNSSPAFLAPPDADWSRLSSSCANGACLSCKLWKWTPFAIGRTLSTDNMLPPHLTVYEMYQLSWQPRWTQVWFYLLDMKPGSGPIVTTIMEILLRVKPL